MQKKWYQKIWVIILFLIFFAPVGIILMYKQTKWNKNIKLITSIIAMMFFISCMLTDTEEPFIELSANDYSVERGNNLSKEELVDKLVENVSDNRTNVTKEDVELNGFENINFTKEGSYPIEVILEDAGGNVSSKDTMIKIVPNEADKKEEVEKKKKEEAEKKKKEEAEKKKKEEAEKKKKEEAEKKKKEEAEKKKKEEAEKKKKEEAEKKKKEEAEKKEKEQVSNTSAQTCQDLGHVVARGDSDYQTKFDRDNDGVGCESESNPTEVMAAKERAEQNDGSNQGEEKVSSETDSSKENVNNTEQNTNEEMTQSASGTTNKALRTAENYILIMDMSETGLRDQLSYEGYTSSEIDYAINNINVDYNLEALGTAQNYVKIMDMSKTGLRDQLSYEGYTSSEIDYAINNISVDYNLEALGTAQNYNKLMSMSNTQLSQQLQYEGYTPEQIQYALNNL